MDKYRWANVSRVREDYLGRSRIASGRPLEAFVEVSARCNLRCRMCAIAHDSRYRADSGRPGLMSPTVFADLRPIFPSLLRAYLYGLGEPILNPHLCAYIEELSTAGVEACFTTNATLIDETLADEIARAGAHRVSVSVDGATPETYEEIRSGARFSDVMRGLDALVEARERRGRPWITVNFVAMESNIDELPELVALLESLGIGELNVEPLFSWEGSEELRTQYCRDSLKSDISGKARAVIRDAQEQAKDSGIHFSSFFLASEGSMDFKERASGAADRFRRICSEPWTTIFVTTAGEVRACCLNDTLFGVLGEDTIEEMWYGEDWSSFRNQHVIGFETPAGCAACVANGRQRLSPFMQPVEPVSYRPFLAFPEPRRGRRSWVLDDPSDGATVTDPLLVTGRVPRIIPSVLRRIGERFFPTVMIDCEPVATIADAVFDGASFALSIRVPYLTEGEHVLSLAIPGERQPGWSRRTFRFWRPHEDRNMITALNTLAVGQRLFTRAREATVCIDGLGWLSTKWLCSRNRAAWRGLTIVDLDGLDAGRHDLVVQFEHHSPSRYLIWRVTA